MLFFDSESEDEEVSNAKIKRRVLRDNSNPLELSEKKFVQQFRVNKECFLMILNSSKLPGKIRSTSVPAILQLCSTLGLLASGSYQINVGTNVLLGMAQTTVSKFFRRTLGFLENEICPQWIRLDSSKFQDSKEYYYRKFKLPGIVGCVDGTHIPILRPKENEHIYFNRKGFHSLNAMVICNHLNEIIAINSSHGGAAHDSAVWNSSNEFDFLKQQFNAGDVSTRFLGDSGYPLQPWLLTPYRNAAEGTAEIRFNNIHSVARSQVERTIGILKGRWRCLSNERKLRFDPRTVTRIVNVCCALHNVCTHFRVPLEQSSLSADRNITQPDVISNSNMNDNLSRIAQNIRNNIKNSL